MTAIDMRNDFMTYLPQWVNYCELLCRALDAQALTQVNRRQVPSGRWRKFTPGAGNGDLRRDDGRYDYTVPAIEKAQANTLIAKHQRGQFQRTRCLWV